MTVRKQSGPSDEPSPVRGAPGPGRQRWALGTGAALVIALVLLAVRNAGGETLIPSRLFVPVNVGVTVLLLLVAAASRMSAGELGLTRGRVWPSLRVAGIVLLVVATVLAVGAALPLTRGLFDDQRVADIDGGGALAFQVLVRIPFGTALLEEVGFRGVLLGLLQRRRSTVQAVAISSVLFGLWHINPTLTLLSTNDLADNALATAGAVAAAVAVTTVGGVFFCLLRLRTGSLVAPLAVHAGINNSSTLAAWFVLRTT